MHIYFRLKEIERERNGLLSQSKQLYDEVGHLRSEHASLDLALSHSPITGIV